MKKTCLTKRLYTILIFTLIFSNAFSQTKEQLKRIVKNYDVKKLEALETKFNQNFFSEKLKATRLAKKNGWPIKYSDAKGSLYELKKVSENGTPIYYQTFNDDAANSTRTSFLHSGNFFGFNLEGQNMTAHVWDGGLARENHAEYDGLGGNNRFSKGDTSTALNFHAAHVTGTIIASGEFSSDAKGMAPRANAVGYDWSNDIAEATAAAANGMLLSNHSYGFQAATIPDWFFGAYIQDSRDWDELMFNTPHYLMVVAAGNDGNDNSSNASPINGNASFDKLSGHATSKNNIVVANGMDASIDFIGNLTSVSRNSGSSEGPTDDLRIKPDIMGNGTGLYSTLESNDFAYGTLTGTSMASPNVCGSLLLLQEHYNNTNGVFMKAATLKGLALHTADDVAAAGPDSETGWGLMNTLRAAQTINNNGLQSWVSEETLTDGNTFTMTVESDGTSPLLASISWTDRAGNISSGIANDPTPVLVNDLDIRITQGGFTGSPWKLTGVNTNATGDNTVDPYERVDVTGAAGTYTITVTHKGSLVGGSQNFSLIVTGLSSNFAFNTVNSSDTVCSNSDATYSFDYIQSGAGTTNFSINNLPPGASSSITPSSLSANGTFDVTIGNLSSLNADTYQIDILGDDGSETETKTITLRVVHPDFTSYPQILSFPNDGAVTVATSTSLIWQHNINAEDYYVEIATDPNFNTIIDSALTTAVEYTPSGLNDSTIYYWRVRPNNSCNNGNFSDSFNFQTGDLTCNTVTQSTPTTIMDETTVSSTLAYPSSSIIEDVNITVDYAHTWIGDVSLALISPAGTVVPLINVLTCTDQVNFNINFDDEAANEISCVNANTNYPTLQTYKPVSDLSAFNGESSNGIWTLEITDDGSGDTGTVNQWSIEVCGFVQTGTTPNFINNGMTVNSNSTYTTLTTDIEASSPSENASQQVYTLTELPTMGDLKKSNVSMTIGETFTQDDVNIGNISYTNSQSIAFIDEFKVNIQNATNGWLSNQIVPINGVLGITQFEIGDLEIYPNPTRGNITVKINNATTDQVFINLYSIQGRNVFNSANNSSSNSFNSTLNLGNLASGVYLIDVIQGNKKATRKIVISR